MNIAQLAQHLSPWALFLQADVIVKSIMVILAVASVSVWAIVIDKILRFRELRARASKWTVALGGSNPLSTLTAQLGDAPNDPFARIYAAISAEWDSSHESGIVHTPTAKDSLKERMDRIGQIATGIEIEKLQRGSQVLATVGSVAPFVGLFGTVWGIINSFQGIAASNNTSLSVVAPGISEALFATALGLVAAIPAVIAYNRTSGDIGSYANRLSALTGTVEVEFSRLLEVSEAHPRVGQEGYGVSARRKDARLHVAAEPLTANEA